MVVGILALQGDFIEHAAVLTSLGMDAVEVRRPDHLRNLSGMIIPGGESTTIGKLAVQYDLIDPLRKFALERPVWGTCAGMVFMAKKTDHPQPLLEVMDIAVKRNAFGAQQDSFETDLYVPALENGISTPFPAVFIRAPIIVSVHGDAEVIAKLKDGTMVAVRQKNLLATAFHPELTVDFRFHRYFLNMI